jgi:hypothetical protein
MKCIFTEKHQNRQPCSGDSKKKYERKRKTVCICLINTDGKV